MWGAEENTEASHRQNTMSRAQSGDAQFQNPRFPQALGGSLAGWITLAAFILQPMRSSFLRSVTEPHSLLPRRACSWQNQALEQVEIWPPPLSEHPSGKAVPVPTCGSGARP